MKVLRERKEVNYAQEKTDTGTPMWLKPPKEEDELKSLDAARSDLGQGGKENTKKGKDSRKPSQFENASDNVAIDRGAKGSKGRHSAPHAVLSTQEAKTAAAPAGRARSKSTALVELSVNALSHATAEGSKRKSNSNNDAPSLAERLHNNAAAAAAVQSDKSDKQKSGSKRKSEAEEQAPQAFPKAVNAGPSKAAVEAPPSPTTSKPLKKMKKADEQHIQEAADSKKGRTSTAASGPKDKAAPAPALVPDKQPIPEAAGAKKKVRPSGAAPGPEDKAAPAPALIPDEHPLPEAAGAKKKGRTSAAAPGPKDKAAPAPALIPDEQPMLEAAGAKKKGRTSAAAPGPKDKAAPAPALIPDEQPMLEAAGAKKKGRTSAAAPGPKDKAAPAPAAAPVDAGNAAKNKRSALGDGDGTVADLEALPEGKAVDKEKRKSKSAPASASGGSSAATATTSAGTAPGGGKGKGASSSNGAKSVAAATAELSAVPPKAAAAKAVASKTVAAARVDAAAAAAIALPAVVDPELTLLLAPVEAGPDVSRAFTTLQGQYMRLQELYQALKTHKIQDLEGLLDEQDEYVVQIIAASKELADKWHLEADAAAERARLAGATETQQKMEALEKECLELRSQALELEAAAVANGEEIASLELQLAVLQQQQEECLRLQVLELEAAAVANGETVALLKLQLADASSAEAVARQANVAELAAQVAALQQQLELGGLRAAGMAEALIEARSEAVRQAALVTDTWAEAERQALAVSDAKAEANTLALLVLELKAEVEKHVSAAAVEEGTLAHSPLLDSLTAGAAALQRSFSTQCPTPAAPSPGVACQFPSPPAPAWLSGIACQFPSPPASAWLSGVACQFPTPPAPAWLSVSKAAGAVPGALLFASPHPLGVDSPHPLGVRSPRPPGVDSPDPVGMGSPHPSVGGGSDSGAAAVARKVLTPVGAGPLGFGVTPAARRSRFASIAGLGVETPLLKPSVAAEPVAVATATTAPEPVASSKADSEDSGSPIDGLCKGQAQVPTESKSDSLARSMVPEGEDPLGPLSPRSPRPPSPSQEEVVDLDPLSPRKLRGAAAVAVETSLNLPLSHSMTDGPSLMRLGSTYLARSPDVHGFQPVGNEIQQGTAGTLAPADFSVPASAPLISSAMAQLIHTARTATAALRSVSRSVNMRVHASAWEGAAPMEVDEGQQSEEEMGGCGQHSHEVSTNLPLPLNYPPHERTAVPTAGADGAGLVGSNQPGSHIDSLPLHSPARVVSAPLTVPKTTKAKTTSPPQMQQPQMQQQQASGSVGDNHANIHTPHPALETNARLSAGTPGLTPRAKGVVSFFGFKVVPQQQEGWYEYIHPETGLRFQLGPSPMLDDAELLEDEEVASGPLLAYRPTSLGKAQLPVYLQEDIWMPASQKQVFVNRIWSALNGHN